jgi:hypothetical protein
LNAATVDGRSSGGICAPYFCGAPAGSFKPGTCTAFNSFGSIHMNPATRLVWIGSGRMNAVYTAGVPSTVRPVGLHSPSPGSGVSTNGFIFSGGGVFGSSVSFTEPTSSARSLGMRPTAADCTACDFGSLSSVPPTFGWFFVYHQRSTELTIGLKPCSRIHSTVRAPIASVPGARSAFT